MLRLPQESHRHLRQWLALSNVWQMFNIIITVPLTPPFSVWYLCLTHITFPATPLPDSLCPDSSTMPLPLILQHTTNTRLKCSTLWGFPIVQWNYSIRKYKIKNFPKYYPNFSRLSVWPYPLFSLVLGYSLFSRLCQAAFPACGSQSLRFQASNCSLWPHYKKPKIISHHNHLFIQGIRSFHISVQSS